MTMRHFGKVVPVHMDMLQLAGYTVDYEERDIYLGRSEFERRMNMRAGRQKLRRYAKQYL